MGNWMASPKTNMTMEKQPFEDVMDLLNMVMFQLVMSLFRGVPYLVDVFGDCFCGATWVAPIWVNYILFVWRSGSQDRITCCQRPPKRQTYVSYKNMVVFTVINEHFGL